MSNQLKYAGIGSRESPQWALRLFLFLGQYFAEIGYTLRSGGAKGADTAFETGCDLGHGKKEIYLPWKGFNYNTSPLYNTPKKAYDMALKYHPRPALIKAKMTTWSFHARNVLQILGQNMDDPCDFVVCYTKGGQRQGGTAQALRIAYDMGIEILDVGLGELGSKPPKKLSIKLERFLTNTPHYVKIAE